MCCDLQEQNVVICPLLDLGFCGQELMLTKLLKLNTDHSVTDAYKQTPHTSVACQGRAQLE